MSYKKFNNNDVFKNVIKTNPYFEFKIYNGGISLNNSLNGYSTIKNELVIPAVSTCANENSFDLTCVDNSQNIALI